jgi:hypothetical protein
MCRKQHSGQLFIEAFRLSFGDTLDPANRWVLLAELMPWQELEETYAPPLNANVGAPAKTVRLACRSLCIKQRLGLMDEATVLQIQESSGKSRFLRSCPMETLAAPSLPGSCDQLTLDSLIKPVDLM